MNKLEANYSTKMTKLQLQFLSMATVFFSTSKINKDLIQEKFIMQKKLDVLSSQLKNLDKKSIIVSNEKHDLHLQINIHKKKNDLQKEKFNEYIQLKDKKTNELKDIIHYLYNNFVLVKQKLTNLNKPQDKIKVDINSLKCENDLQKKSLREYNYLENKTRYEDKVVINNLSYETNFSKEKISMLNIILNIIKYHNETFTIQVIINNYIEQHNWRNFIMSNVLVIFRIAYKYIIEKINENIKNKIKSTFVEKDINENNLDYTPYFGVIKKVHIFKKNKHIKIFNIDMELNGLFFLVRDKKNNEMIIYLKNKNEKKLNNINNSKTSKNDVNFAISTSFQNIQRDNAYKKNKSERYKYVTFKLWLFNCKNDKFLNSMTIIKKIKICSKIKNKSYVTIMIRSVGKLSCINQFFIHIMFYNIYSIWNFEINPCIWDPGISNKNL